MMQGSDALVGMIPYLIPLLVLAGTLIVVALVDLAKRKHVTGGHKLIWVAVILGVQAIGPIVYLVAGRKEEKVERD